MRTSNKPLQLSDTKLPVISFLIALSGASLAMWGGSWDVTSHLLRTPETFFTPSHAVLYSGVGISVISAVLSLVFLIRKKESSSYSFGSKLILIGAVMQLAAGPGDFLWHDAFGIDGFLSPTHVALVLGIMIVIIGTVIGLGRIHLNLDKKSNLLKVTLPVSFGILWFSVMWFTFFFVLPISEGDTHNFNPDPYVGLITGFIALPFVFSVVFWATSKTFSVFGASTVAALSFVVMNVTSNILTTEDLWIYLPWFAAPIVSAIAADYVLNKKNSVLEKHSAKISGAVLGSMFFIFCFPMLSMSFLEFYVYNDVFPYDVLGTSYELNFEIWLMTVIPGAVSGMTGMIFASKKLNF